MPPDNPPNTPSDPESPIFSWAFLLARWTDFARAAALLPPDGQGPNWKASVAPAITLHALSMALRDWPRLPAAERPLALDMAELLIRQNAAALNAAWHGEPMPDNLQDLIADAQLAHALAASHGYEWIIPPETTSPFEMPALTEWARALIAAGFTSDALAAPEGTLLFANEPAIFLHGELPASALSNLAAPPAPHWTPHFTAPRQIYRQIDERTGLITRDLIAPMNASLPPGRPLLAPLIDQGNLVAPNDPAQTKRWKASQHRALNNKAPSIDFESQSLQ